MFETESDNSIIQNSRQDYIQIMINARASDAELESLEINLDQEEEGFSKREKIKSHSTKRMTLKASK